MMTINFDGPDDGLVKALELYPPDKCSRALDLGSHFGRQAMAMVPYCPTTAVDINHHYQQDALDFMERTGVRFDFQLADVLKLNFEPGTVGVASVGMIIYVCKSEALSFLQKVATWLSPNGILHAQFALVGDQSEDCEFVRMGCAREKDFDHSYIFLGLSCGGCNACLGYGYYGGSFWTQEEADQAILGLNGGSLKIIFREPQFFETPSVGAHGYVSEEVFKRAFYNVTAVKTA